MNIENFSRLLEDLELFKKDSKLLINTIHHSLFEKEDKLLNVFVTDFNNIMPQVLREVLKNYEDKYYVRNTLYKLESNEGHYKLNGVQDLSENAIIIVDEHNYIEYPKPKSSLRISKPYFNEVHPEYKYIEKHKNPKTRKKYIEEYNTDKIVIRLSYGTYFIVDRQILIMTTAAKNYFENYNSDLMGEIALLFDSIYNSEKEKLEKILNYNAEFKIKELKYSELYLKLSVANRDTRDRLNRYENNLQRNIDNLQNQYLSALRKKSKFYKLKDESKVSSVGTKLIKELTKEAYNNIIDTVDVLVNCGIHDTNISCTQINIVTKPIPQSYIELNELNRCKQNIATSAKHLEIMNKLQNNKVDLYLYPIKIAIQLSEESFINEQGLVNVFFNIHSLNQLRLASQNHAFYNTVNNSWSRGCLGGFAQPLETTLTELEASNEEVEEKLVKRLVNYLIQYITTTNVNDYAGHQNLTYGLYTDRNGNVVYRKIYGGGEVNYSEQTTPLNIKNIKLGVRI